MRQGWPLLVIFCFSALSACGGMTSSLRNKQGVCTVTKIDHPRGPKAELQESLGCFDGTKIASTEGGISITIPCDSLFKPDSDRMKPANWSEIDALADVVKKYPEANIKVDVYTDCIHYAERNLALSTLQAWMIKRALVYKGIAPSRITAQGWGESRPVASNATAEGRKANRRIKITFEQG